MVYTEIVITQEALMNKNIQLLIIDPQNDFCDVPEAYQPIDPLSGQRVAPALPVAGAHQDMLRLARLIRDGGTGLSEIIITLDSHQRLDIAHPTFWQQADGSAVAPFTQITADQVRAGGYRPRDAAMLARARADRDELEARGRYTLMVWPVHCEIGTWGHNVHADLRAAYNVWEEQQLAVVQKVVKGTNPWTEHYSAVLAEVPDQEDPATQLNENLIRTLDAADLILIGGEAGSHCVKATTEHLVANLKGPMSRIVLLTDAMSAVGGFEAQQQVFLADMAAQGVQWSTTADMLPQLLTNVQA
jgi:nicotinamidase/pyrazinamidase